CGFMALLSASLIVEASQADALVTTQVTSTVHRAKTTLSEQLAHCRRLVEAVFQQQPATCMKIARRLLDDQANIIQTIRARHQRTARLETHIAFGQVTVIGSNIRRVAGNQLITLPNQSTEPVALDKVGIG